MDPANIHSEFTGCLPPKTAIKWVAVWYLIWAPVSIIYGIIFCVATDYVIEGGIHPHSTAETLLMILLLLGFFCVTAHGLVCTIMGILTIKRTWTGQKLTMSQAKRLHSWGIVSLGWQLIQNPVYFGTPLVMVTKMPSTLPILTICVFMTLAIQIPVISATKTYVGICKLYDNTKFNPLQVDPLV